MKRKLINTTNRLAPIILSAIVIIIWQYITSIGFIKPYVLPSPLSIIGALYEILPKIGYHIFVTLYESLLGFVVSIVISVILAVIMDNVSLIKKALYPIIIISQTVPIIALAPLFIIWFGFGSLPKIIVVILVCFFPIVISLMQGFNSVEQDMLDLFYAMGADRVSIYKHLKFPAAMSYFFSGLRIAATYSVMGAIIGEWLGGSSGLGVYMLRAKHSYLLDNVFAVILIVVLLSMMFFKTIELLQKACMPWGREN